jgi:membrane protease YdiL (CAAX protease family)
MNIFINEREQRPRAGWRLLFQFVLMVLLIGLGMVGFQYIWSNPTGMASTIPQFIGVTASVWIAARLLDKRSFSDYGLNINRQWWTEFLSGIIIAAIAVGFIFIIEWFAGWLTITGYGWETPANTGFGWRIAGLFVVMLMVGFYEELFSRGYQILNLSEGLNYPTIGTRSAVALALVLTSLLFGFLHFFNPNASVISTFNIILAGVVLGIPYILTGSLALSTGLHFSWNFVMGGVLGFPVSGMKFKATIIQINQQGAELWTGGALAPKPAC